jgi:hypothetical protein
LRTSLTPRNFHLAITLAPCSRTRYHRLQWGSQFDIGPATHWIWKMPSILWFRRQLWTLSRPGPRLPTCIVRDEILMRLAVNRA